MYESGWVGDFQANLRSKTKGIDFTYNDILKERDYTHVCISKTGELQKVFDCRIVVLGLRDIESKSEQSKEAYLNSFNHGSSICNSVRSRGPTRTQV